MKPAAMTMTSLTMTSLRLLGIVAEEISTMLAICFFAAAVALLAHVVAI